MLKRLAFILLAGVSISSYAQTLSTSATITDSDGTVWANGSYAIQIFSPNGTPYFGTTPVPTAPITGVLNGSGAFSGVTLYNTSTITPLSAVYIFTICSNTSAPCSVFSTGITTTNLTSLLSGLVTAPRFSLTYSSFGYVDAEVINPGKGGTYFNLTSQQNRTWNGTAFVAGGGGGGSGTVTSVAVTTANGVSGTVANATTTPAISLVLGAINPTSIGITTATQVNEAAGSLNFGDATGTPSRSETITATNSGATTGIPTGLGCTITHTFISTTNYTALAICIDTSASVAIYRSSSHALGAESYTMIQQINAATLTAGPTGNYGVVGANIKQGENSVASSATPTFSNAVQASTTVLTANITTFTLAAGSAGQGMSLRFCQNGTGGFTVTPPSNVLLFGSVDLTPNACSAQHYYYSSTATAWVADSLMYPISPIIAGHGTLVGGTVTINTTAAVAVGGAKNYSITRTTTGGTLGFLTIGTVVPGTSFIVNSSSGSDTSLFDWSIF